jgi:hypothetical protein
MTRVSKLAVIATISAAIATPAFAQSFDPEVGSGNVAPFSYAPTVVQNNKVAAHQSGRGKIAAHRSGLHAFAMVPGAAPVADPNNPALTGGGSAGYNQMLLQY